VIPKAKQAKPQGQPKKRKAVLPPRTNILPDLIAPAPTTAATVGSNPRLLRGVSRILNEKGLQNANLLYIFE
jgi:hypothetical protein